MIDSIWGDYQTFKNGNFIPFILLWMSRMVETTKTENLGHPKIDLNDLKVRLLFCFQACSILSGECGIPCPASPLSARCPLKIVLDIQLAYGH
ncbi:hypothetical protein K1F50_07760 [Muricauda oceani]|uniref:Uncharacterized protein n=1 Tax=Flagellimonas oceani TaxID=2698672 RepID=A0A6G7J3W4_9FLAO|nr:hypothetical protein [Allomuricauda oceani]MBW8242694.1 hypothetical protein [Allomuricauda oceani]QII45563.1 hypothetical protein GVT53_13055 [Allomuricauda oceani]